MLKKTFAFAGVLALLLLAWPAPCAADEPAGLEAPDGTTERRGNIDPWG